MEHLLAKIKAEIRTKQAKLDAWLAEMSAWPKETTACQEVTEACLESNDPTSEEIESEADNEKIPMAAVKPAEH
jgi:hypothetical protein